MGRTWELASIAGMLDEAIGGAGCVVGLVGPPGIGKSRIVREATTRATEREVDVFTAFCESHTSDLPFHAASALLTAAMDIAGLDKAAARAGVRSRVPDVDADDLLLLDDLLGIADPAAATPSIEPDARRRRLTGLLDAALTARNRPTVFVIEDVHWIDEPSEALLTRLVEVAPETPTVILLTYRPEYRGTLANVQGAQTITLRPLNASQTTALTSELLGRHSSVHDLVEHIADRAAGNPFFAEEIVRDLAERGVLEGVRAKYTCCADLADIRVPATLQAAIAARIDRLGPAAKRTLSAASVIGTRFNPDLLDGLGVTPVFDELVAAELVSHVQVSPHDEYAFKHPLIRTVAYEAQLKSDRVELHRRLAAVIAAQGCGDEKAAQIAEHVEASGDLRTAFDWHMRAGQWLTNRDIAAARSSWQRARQVADRLPADEPNRQSLRIEPRTLLCASAYRGRGRIDESGFDELRELCEQAGDRRSLAIAMSGMLVTMTLLNQHRTASRLAAEQVQIVESLDDPTSTVNLLLGAITAKIHVGEVDEAMRLAQHAIDTADGDVTIAEVVTGSVPLAQATVLRGLARCCLGRRGWRADLDAANELARHGDSATQVIVLCYPLGMLLLNGALRADDALTAAAHRAWRTAEQLSDDFSLSMAGFAYSAASLAQTGHADIAGAGLLENVIEATERQGNLFGLLTAQIALARYQTEVGALDAAITLSRTLVEDTFGAGEMVLRGPAVAAVVEALLQRGTDDDVCEARSLVDRLTAAPTEPGFVLFDLPLLRLRALLARSDGDDAGYRAFRDQYRSAAKKLDFQGHLALADAMA
ncbi:cyclase [Mycobacterium sp. shizuoka-1]|nr:cyclase [Mycobacterium sp. shizuoka-1]